MSCSMIGPLLYFGLIVVEKFCKEFLKRDFVRRVSALFELLLLRFLKYWVVNFVRF